MKYFKDLEHNDYQNILDEETGDNQTTDTATQNVEDVEESLKERRYAIRNLVWYIKLGSLDKSKRNTTIAIIAFNVIFILIAGAVIAVKCSQNNQETQTSSGEETFDVGSVRLPIMLFDQNHPKIRLFKGILKAKTRKNKSNSTQTLKVDTQFVFAVKGHAEIDPDAWDDTRLYLQTKVFKDKQISVEEIEKGDIVEISDDDCIVVQNIVSDSNQTTYMDYVRQENKELENTTSVHQLEGQVIINKEPDVKKDVKAGSEQEQKPIVKEKKMASNADESEEDSAEKSSVEKVSEKVEQKQKPVDKKEKSTSDSEEDSEEISSEEFNIEKFEEDIADIIAYIA